MTAAIGNHPVPCHPHGTASRVPQGKGESDRVRFPHVRIRLQGAGQREDAHQEGDPRPGHGGGISLRSQRAPPAAPLAQCDSVYGVIVDDHDKFIKGLLISYAEQGALIDMIYDSDHGLSWATREKWARQIVEGLSEIHEAGFVQGDFTLSNIVIDNDDNAKIIDINRRGCPVGWEPPEATPLIESSQRISMYIGVKSDLYQLGMVLWALATQGG